MPGGHQLSYYLVGSHVRLGTVFGLPVGNDADLFESTLSLLPSELCLHHLRVWYRRSTCVKVSPWSSAHPVLVPCACPRPLLCEHEGGLRVHPVEVLVASAGRGLTAERMRIAQELWSAYVPASLLLGH